MNNRQNKYQVLILEPHASGHHGPTLQWMVKGLLKGGARVTVVTLPETTEHPSFKALLDDAEGSARLKVVAASSGLAQRAQGFQAKGRFIAREITYWRLFRRWYDAYQTSAEPGVVFLPYLDYCLHAIGLLGSPFRDCPWSGLGMRPAFHYQDMGVIAPKPSLGRVKKQLFFRMLGNRNLRKFLTIDEPLFEYVQRIPRYQNNIAFVSEPAAFPSLPRQGDAKHQLRLDADSKYVLVYGAISARKGVKELIQALQHVDFPGNVNVLVAGKVAAEIRLFLDNKDIATLAANGRLVVVDRFIEDREEALFFAAADVVWAGYRGHYASSGVLAQATAAHKPLLACREGVLGWRTERHRLGISVDPSDPAQVASAVSHLCAAQKGRTYGGQAASWQPADFSEAGAAVSRAVCE